MQLRLRRPTLGIALKHSKMRYMLLAEENPHRSITVLLTPQSWATQEPCKTPSNNKHDNKHGICTKNWKTQYRSYATT